MDEFKDPPWTAAVFRSSVPLRLRDWDVNDHLGHISYLELAEVARLSHLESLGIPVRFLLNKQRTLVILEAQASYLAELLPGADTIECTSAFSGRGGKIIHHRQTVIHDGRTLCSLEFVMGLLDIKERRLRANPIDELQSLIDEGSGRTGHEKQADIKSEPLSLGPVATDVCEAAQA